MNPSTSPGPNRHHAASRLAALLRSVAAGPVRTAACLAAATVFAPGAASAATTITCSSNSTDMPCSVASSPIVDGPEFGIIAWNGWDLIDFDFDGDTLTVLNDPDLSTGFGTPLRITFSRPGGFAGATLLSSELRGFDRHNVSVTADGLLVIDLEQVYTLGAERAVIVLGSVPEPTNWIAMAAGLGAVGWSLRRRPPGRSAGAR